MSEPAHGPSYAELQAVVEELRSDIKVIVKSRDKWLVACKERDATITRLTRELEEAKAKSNQCPFCASYYELDANCELLKAENAELKTRLLLFKCKDCAENAALRGEAALYQKEWAILREEVERLKALYNEWGFADAPCPKHSKPPMLPSCGQCRAEQAEAEVVRWKAEFEEKQRSWAESDEHKNAEELRDALDAVEKELADLKDGLTAAHMDGFASGKAEATEMLRKREGQLEELRAEVKAYREVEDSLQKEIKRLDKEVASLTQELEEARSMIQWERGAKNGAYELIEQQDKLKAETAALREEAALYQKEWAILRAEVERLNHAIAHMRWALEDSGIDSSAVEQGECLYKKALERTCDCEFNEDGNLVDECDYHAALRTRAEQAEKELAELQGS